MASVCPVRAVVAWRRADEAKTSSRPTGCSVRNRAGGSPLTRAVTVASKREMPNATFTANIGKALDWMLELFESDPALAPKAKL